MSQSSDNNVTDAELAVVKELWRHGPSTIRQLTDLLYPEGGTAHYATVQKLLDRLEAKRCVARAKNGRTNVFSATVQRSDLIRNRLREAADKLCEGSLSPLLTNLVSTGDLSGSEIHELRSLLDQLEQASEES